MENKPEYNPQVTLKAALTPRLMLCVITKIISGPGKRQSIKDADKNLKNIIVKTSGLKAYPYQS